MAEQIDWKSKPAQSVPETAIILGISRSLAYEAVKSGDIKALKIGAKRLIVPTATIIKMLGEAAGE